MRGSGVRKSLTGVHGQRLNRGMEAVTKNTKKNVLSIITVQILTSMVKCLTHFRLIFLTFFRVEQFIYVATKVGGGGLAENLWVCAPLPYHRPQRQTAKLGECKKSKSWLKAFVHFDHALEVVETVNHLPIACSSGEKGLAYAGAICTAAVSQLLSNTNSLYCTQ